MNDTIDATYTETGSALVVRHEDLPSSLFAAMRPKERIQLATEMADVLKDVLEKKGLIVRIPGKNGAVSEHVKAEGWQTCGALCGVSARIVSTTKTENGYEAKAEAVRLENGVVVGGGEAVCTKDEKRWSYADEYAIKSMAQTRAISKALRGVLAWVIVLAGYNPTPAEEVPSGGFQDASPRAGRRSQPVIPTNEQTAELVALAKSLNIPSLRTWLVANITPDFDERERKVLSLDEHNRAMDLLDAFAPPVAPEPAKVAPAPAPRPAAPPRPPKPPKKPAASPDDDGSKMQARTQGRLFALCSERLSMDQAARHTFAAEHGIVVGSWSELTEMQGRTLIKKLEMIPPAPDPDDALLAYAEGKLL